MATGQRATVELRGVIKHAYPLQSLDDETRTLSAAFSLGRGPCGHSGVRKIVAWEVQLQNSFDTCYVFLYDAWADAVQRFQRHFRVHLRGNGLVAVDHWDIGHDTEDVQRCFVVAEPQVLRNTHERTPRLLPRASGTTLEIGYEEPQSLPDTDQLMYLPPQVLRTRDLLHAQKDGGSTASLGRGQPRANARGKRQLAEYQAPTGSHATLGTPYMYTKLGELIPGYASLYGVVVNTSLPKRSEGSDYYMSIHIIDETTPRREDATQVMVFYPSLDKMPKILFVGDVVRFHKIKINRYQDRIQGICSSRATRCLVLRTRDDGTIEQQTESSSWTFDHSDEERFRELSEWSRHVLRSDVTLPPGCPQSPRLLGDMAFAESFTDVVARVLHVQPPYQEFTAARFIVWDGSGDDTTCRDLYEKLKRHKDEVAFIPTRGLLMEIIIDSCWVVMERTGLLSRVMSQWCRFRNLAVAAEQSEGANAKQWYELHFREVSSVMLVPDFVPDVQLRDPRPDQLPSHVAQPAVHLRRGSEATAASALALQLVTASVPRHIIDKVPITPIQVVLTTPQVPRKYRCHARVTRLWPSDVSKICKRAATNDSAPFVYSFVLRLADSTGELDAIVHGSDAEAFLQGIPPSDLTQPSGVKARIEKLLASLLSPEQAPINCCLKSYRPATQSSTATIRYRLFDTRLEFKEV